jgi:hypothetical protein
MRSRRLNSSAFRVLAVKRLAVAVLAVALLSTIAPFEPTSHAQGCSMPCCAGGSCSTGACDVSFRSPEKPSSQETHCEHDEQPKTVEVDKINPPQQIDISELCGVDHLIAYSVPPVLPVTQHQQSLVKASRFSKSCSSECRAGVAMFSHLRRTRDVATSGEILRPRSPGSALLSRDNLHPVFLGLHLRRLSPPRAPPVTPSHA